MTFDYGLPAELFMAKRKGGARSRLISRRFATAAEAIRFAGRFSGNSSPRRLDAGRKRALQWGRHPSPLREPPFSATMPNRLSARLTDGAPRHCGSNQRDFALRVGADLAASVDIRGNTDESWQRGLRPVELIPSNGRL